MADNYYLEHTGAQLDEAIRKVLSGELDVPLQEKSVTPSTSKQIVFPDTNYKGLSRVTVEAIPQSYTDEIYNQGYEAGYNAEKPYQKELSYIESTGTQYIDTGIKPNETMKFVVEITPLSTGLSETAIFGSAWSASGFFLMFYNSTIRWHSKGASVDVSSFNATSKNTIEASSSGLVVNGTSYNLNGTGSDTTDNIYLFSVANNSGYNAKNGIYKLHSCKIYEGDLLIRDYIPVLDSAGVPCLYDKVNKTFTYNAGTGKFKYPSGVGGTVKVNSITTTGSYNSSTYHGDYWAAIDENGTLLLVVNGGTSTSYESIYFTTASIPSGVTFLKQSYYSYSSMSVSVPYVAVFSGITSSVDITLNFSGVNSSSDYVTCTVTIS